MAAEKLYPTPLEQLSVLLAAGKSVEEEFDVVWERLWAPGRVMVLVTECEPPAGAIRWPTDRATRRQWQDAIRESEGTWRRSYDSQPASDPEVALARLDPGMRDLRSMFGSVADEVIIEAADNHHQEIVELMEAA